MSEGYLMIGVKLGEDIEFEYNSTSEIQLTINDHTSYFNRDDAIELHGFLSQFIDQELDGDIW